MKAYAHITKSMTRMLFGLIFFLAITAGTVRAETYTYDVTYGQTEARTILDMVNALRTGGSWVWNESSTSRITVSPLPALKWDYDLEKAAITRAEELALRYSHTRPDGSKFCSGYQYTTAAENIAYGYDSARAVFNAWLEENANYAGQGHRRNMLEQKVTAIAIGHVKRDGTDYWAMELRAPVVSTAYVSPKEGTGTVTKNLKPLEPSGTNSESTSGHSYSAEASCYKPSIGGQPEPVQLMFYYDGLMASNTNYIAVSTNPKVLTLSSDLAVTALAPGKASVEIFPIIKGYTMETPLVLDFEIDPINLGIATITLPKYEYDYTGSEIRPVPTIKYGDILLKEGVDYRLRYRNNKDYKQGNYAYVSADATDHPDCRTTGTITERFSIIRCDITKLGIRLPQEEYVYDGWAVKPGIVAPGLIEGDDYYLDYYDNYSPGAARVRVTGRGNYTGTIYLDYMIVTAPRQETQPAVQKTETISKPAKPVISSAKNKKGKKIKVVWEKQKNITGYQLRYKTGKKTRILTIPRASAKSAVIFGLKKKKTYTITLRSYRKVSGVTVYSKWSKSKKVKVRK